VKTVERRPEYTRSRSKVPTLIGAARKTRFSVRVSSVNQ